MSTPHNLTYSLSLALILSLTACSDPEAKAEKLSAEVAAVVADAEKERDPVTKLEQFESAQSLLQEIKKEYGETEIGGRVASNRSVGGITLTKVQQEIDSIRSGPDLCFARPTQDCLTNFLEREAERTSGDNRFQMLFGTAKLEACRGHTERALQLLDRYKVDRKRYVEALASLATEMHRCGHTENAGSVFDIALESLPSDKLTALQFLISADWPTESMKFQAAERAEAMIYDQATGIAPNERVSWGFSVAVAYLNGGDNENPKRIFSRVREEANIIPTTSLMKQVAEGMLNNGSLEDSETWYWDHSEPDSVSTLADRATSLLDHAANFFSKDGAIADEDVTHVQAVIAKAWQHLDKAVTLAAQTNRSRDAREVPADYYRIARFSRMIGDEESAAAATVAGEKYESFATAFSRDRFAKQRGYAVLESDGLDAFDALMRTEELQRNSVRTEIVRRAMNQALREEKFDWLLERASLIQRAAYTNRSALLLDIAFAAIDASQFDYAQDLAESIDSRSERAKLYARMGVAKAKSGDIAGARAVMELEFTPLNANAKANILVAEGRYHHEQGDNEKAFEVLSEASKIVFASSNIDRPRSLGEFGPRYVNSKINAVIRAYLDIGKQDAALALMERDVVNQAPMIQTAAESMETEEQFSRLLLLTKDFNRVNRFLDVAAIKDAMVPQGS